MPAFYHVSKLHIPHFVNQYDFVQLNRSITAESLCIAAEFEKSNASLFADGIFNYADICLSELSSMTS